jgi:hypothetical protein
MECAGRDLPVDKVLTVSASPTTLQVTLVSYAQGKKSDMFSDGQTDNVVKSTNRVKIQVNGLQNSKPAPTLGKLL